MSTSPRTAKVSIQDFNVPTSSSRSSSIASNKDGVQTSPSRANSVSRRASLPAQRVSISEKPASGPILLSAATSNATPSASEKQASSRRASVATGMLSAPFQKSPKEAPRWRPYTYQAQVSAAEGGKPDDSEQSERLSAEESIKPLNQKIFEKTAVSLALGLFVILMAFVGGSIARILVRKDLGIFGLWINQLVIVLIFLNDKRPEMPSGGTRMENLTAFEIGTLICQGLPILYVLLFGHAYTYYGMSIMIILQATMKFFLMNLLGQVVEISL
jgi:hypothetical protein